MIFLQFNKNCIWYHDGRVSAIKNQDHTCNYGLKMLGVLDRKMMLGNLKLRSLWNSNLRIGFVLSRVLILNLGTLRTPWNKP